MKISVAMATYNGAAHLPQQLESFCLQSRVPDELVVCDDGSGDNTPSVLENFADRAGFEVRLFRNHVRLGFTGNFDRAIGLCSGDLIFLSDQDDVWYPNKISTVVSAFEETPDALLLVHDGRLVDADERWHGATMLGQVLDGYGSSRSLVTGALTAFRKDLRDMALPIPAGIVGHDQWLHLIGALLERRVVIPDVLQRIRRHASNTSGWVASSPSKITKIDVFRSQATTTAADSYADRLLINQSALDLLSRLASSGGQTSFVAKAKIPCLEAERCALLARNELVAMPARRRLGAAWKLLLSGGYGHFNGIKSFVRDILR